MTHILIVDDKDENLYYLTALLEGHKYTVETARHGAEALVKARKKAPELVISDLLMPVMDGYTLLRHWKADERLKTIPFIVYTATYTEAEDERLALSLGADAFILKPAEPDDFLSRIHEVMSRKSAGVPATPKSPTKDEKALLKVYSETLIRKLEEKTMQLEEANAALQRDLVERNKTEATLRESEERFRQLAENISEVFWITDTAKNKMLYVSPAYAEIWGRTCQSLYDQPGTWLEAVHPEDRERISRAALKKQSSGNYNETYRIQRPDGTIRWINDRAFPVTNEQGEVYRIVGIAADITEKKKMETQFLRAQRMESIGTLAGGIAHDLNNVLAPVMMSISILKSKVSDEEGLALLDTLETCTQRGADLVKQVLTFARGLDGQRIPVNLNRLGKDIEKIIHETFPKTIEVVSDYDPGLWPVTGDPTQIHQVLMNLCVNARDAMPSGGKLTISMENIVLDEVYAGMNPESRAGSYVVVQVADNGSGIPQEFLERIFEPFFTTKELGHGTGLGLSTTQAIVNSHGGFINLYSEPAKGTRFKVYFPAQTDGQTREKVSVEKSGLPRGSGQTILVVDDEQTIREVAQKTLERYGYKVIPAANGVEAVSIYAQQRAVIDLVLTDMAMPFMDGPMTIAALKAMNPAICIIGSSGLADNAMLTKALAGGVSHFVPKPYTAETLLNIIHKCLQEKPV